MPAGYWRRAFHVLWQTTLVNSVIIVATNWAFNPFDLYSLFAPVAALFFCFLLTTGAVFIASIFGLLVSLISRRAVLSSAGIGFTLVYTVYCFNLEARYLGDPTSGMDGYQFLLALVALGIWLAQMRSPFNSRIDPL
jgi:type III secretory pathway component EscS